MTTPQISVIVPVYKAEDYLCRCVDSLLAQTFQDYEILLIDDGSPDGSGQICDEYARLDHRIKVVHKSNGGVSSARNEGIKNASGEWITFIDSDDYIDPSYLKDFGLDQLNADIYLQGYKVKQDNKIIAEHSFSTRKNDFYSTEQLYIEGESNDILNSPVCKLFHSPIIKLHNIFFDTNISYGEDHLFVLEYLYYAQRIAVSPAMSYYYVFCNNSSLTRRIVPYQELLYYLKSARELQINLVGRKFLSSIQAKTVLNNRSYWIFIQSLQNIFYNKISLNAYKAFKQEFSSIEFGYSGLTRKQKLLLYLFLEMPTSCSYFMFKLLIKILK